MQKQAKLSEIDKIKKKDFKIKVLRMDYCKRKLGGIYLFDQQRPDAKHPFAILGLIDAFTYLGCMITHGDPNEYEDNLPMQPNFFEDKDENGDPATVRYTVNEKGIPSHFVRVGLRKGIDLSLNPAGLLTREGFDHMLSFIEKSDPERWISYKKHSYARRRKRLHLINTQNWRKSR